MNHALLYTKSLKYKLKRLNTAFHSNISYITLWATAGVLIAYVDYDELRKIEKFKKDMKRLGII